VNADYLVRNGAALQLLDADLMEKLGHTVLSLIKDSPRRMSMQRAMAGLAKPDAAMSIARILMNMSERAS
jgi:UDP-N-acetylglucosamine:LPS N-acetylglucosamine transferase